MYRRGSCGYRLLRSMSDENSATYGTRRVSYDPATFWQKRMTGDKPVGCPDLRTSPSVRRGGSAFSYALGARRMRREAQARNPQPRPGVMDCGFRARDFIAPGMMTLCLRLCPLAGVDP
jgi:hypothetical protein